MKGHHYPHSDFSKETYFRNKLFRKKIYDARIAGYDIYINTVRKLCNCLQARRERGQIRIMDVIQAGWDDFKKENAARLTRPGVIDAVDKAITCGTVDMGFMVAECPKCGDSYLIRFTCKSRFCPSCGKKYRDTISASVREKLYDVPHRQFVFSVPEPLRIWFRRHRDMLDLLFSSVSETLNETVFSSAPIARKKEHRQLGFVSFLHTFGRDLKWHPHLHVLIAEDYSSDDGKRHHISFFPFEAIRKRFMYTLLSSMEKWIVKNFPSEARLFRADSRMAKAKYTNGFYFYGPRMKANRLTDFAQLAKYVARYASHPPISESRVDSFDKNNKTVTWHYDPHEDDGLEESEKRGRQYVTESIQDFIARLLVHIPDQGFQQIRYYGFYSNRTTSKPSHKKMQTEEQSEEVRRFLRWEQMLLSVYGYSPLICDCGARMKINHSLSYYPGRTFEEWKKEDSG